jgi:serine/threonine protein phosphatase 1
MMTMSLAPAVLPAGQRVYAIGDVHGCRSRLEMMHSLIAEDLVARPVAEPTVVHLGDYIDRGEDSAGVLARLLRPFPVTPAPRLVNLTGNHEDMMLAALDSADTETLLQWLSNGGAAALASWGISPRAPPAEWRHRIPADQLAFLRGLGLYHRQGGYVFVPFLSSRAGFPGVVVHGHTPERMATVRAHRIGVDTGAVMGGVLTCVVLEGDRVGFLYA